MKRLTLSPSWVRRHLPDRRRVTHKGQAGRILILAGSREMSGAGILTAWGAMAGGAGLVRLLTVSSVQKAAALRAPLEVTTLGLPEDAHGFLSSKAWLPLIKAIKNFSPHVIALGPGLGVGPAVKKIVNRLVKESRVSLVLDADGLNVLARGKIKRKSPLIMTPHPGEMGRLFNASTKMVEKARENFAFLAARRYSAVCLLKGPGTLITDGKLMLKNPTGTPAMASGGMGDILTGLIAALWGQLKGGDASTALQAAAVGAFIHGLAAERAAKRKGALSVLASEVAAFIPGVIRFLKN